MGYDRRTGVFTPDNTGSGKSGSGGGGGKGFQDFYAYQQNVARLQNEVSQAMQHGTNSDQYMFALRNLRAYVDKYKGTDWGGGGGGGGGGGTDPTPYTGPYRYPRGEGGPWPRNDGGLVDTRGGRRGGEGTGWPRNDGGAFDASKSKGPTGYVGFGGGPEAMGWERNGFQQPRQQQPKRRNDGGLVNTMPQQGFSKGGKVLSNKQLSQRGTPNKWGK